MKMLTKSRAVRCAAAAVATFSAAGLAVHDAPVASADPQSATALVGVGSDTIQDVMNAMAGFSNGINYTPIQSSAASGTKQIASWDAIPAGSCITPKPGPTFDRPNGSTNGRRALSRAIDGTTWGVTGSPCAPAKATAGLVDFARSSAGPGTTTATDLTYLGFGRDAVGFAFAMSPGSTAAAVTTLTTAQLQGLYTTTTGLVVGGVNIIACLPQTGSGTRNFWVTTSMNTTDATATTATTACNGTVQENDATQLKNKAGTFTAANTEVIVPFSAASFIAQSNGKAPSTIGTTGVDLGAIDALGKPYTGTVPSLAPSATFYNSTSYGRHVFNVINTAIITGLAGANQDIKTLLVGPTSAICSAAAQATVNAFGFLSLPSTAGAGNCGDTSLTGPLVA